jgi:hypothetical protein
VGLKDKQEKERCPSHVEEDDLPLNLSPMSRSASARPGGNVELSAERSILMTLVKTSREGMRKEDKASKQESAVATVGGLV